MDADKTNSHVCKLPRYIDTPGIIFYSLFLTFIIGIFIFIVFFLFTKPTAEPWGMSILAIGMLPVIYLIAINLSWRLTGYESVNVNDNSMTLTKACFGFSRTKVFKRSSISRVKIVGEEDYFPNKRESLHLVFVFKGTISFNYKMFEYGIGYRQDGQDVHKLYEIMKLF